MSMSDYLDNFFKKNEEDSGVIFTHQAGIQNDINGPIAKYYNKEELEEVKQWYTETYPHLPEYLLKGAILLYKDDIKKAVDAHDDLMGILHDKESVEHFLTTMAMNGIDIEGYKRAVAEQEPVTFHSPEEHTLLSEWYSNDSNRSFMKEPPYVLGWYSPEDNVRRILSQAHITVNLTALNFFFSPTNND